MQKLFLFSAVSAIFAFSLLAQAAQPGRYVRKQLKPNFFIPEKDLDYTEKLPEFNYYPEASLPKAIRPNSEPEQVIKVIKAPEQDVAKTVEQAALPQQTESPYIEYDKNELAQIPEYKQKYDDYINDLKEIAKSGKLPENPRVAFDLMKMSTNARLVVTDKFGLYPTPE